MAVADGDDFGQQVYGGEIDDAFTALFYQFMTMVVIDDHTADEGRIKFHKRVPAHGHDVELAFVMAGDEDDGAGFEEAADAVYREAVFFEWFFQATSFLNLLNQANCMPSLPHHISKNLFSKRSQLYKRTNPLLLEAG